MFNQVPDVSERIVSFDRFLQEYEIVAGLKHRHIVRIYDLGVADDHAYIAMEHFPAGDLRQRMKTPLSPATALEYLEQIGSALHAIHSVGVLHRDLKPANVMLGDYGETLVLDWGLAKDIKQTGSDPALWSEGAAGAAARTASVPHSGTGSGISGPPVSKGGSVTSPTGNPSAALPTAELTMHGQVIGTPAYMAPEQAEGRTDQHAPVTDIYALGGILYKILTGQSPQAPTASGSCWLAA